jgi:hypothetical protein
MVTADRIDLSMISGAISDAVSSAEARMYSARGGAYDRARSDHDFATRAQAEVRKLQEVWPRAREALAAQARAYDAYVLSPREDGPEEGCSCHINPPCGFCTNQGDPDA